MGEPETPFEAAARVRQQLGSEELIVCILGSTKFSGPDSEALVQAMARELEQAVGPEAKFITGGMAGVQEAFARGCGDGSRVWNMVPYGEASAFDVGGTLNAGVSMADRRAIFGLLGDLYITVEGGPGVSEEARAAHGRGAKVLPLHRTGGASAGMFDFPSAAMKRPEWATEQQWSLLADKEVPVDETALAVASVVKELATRHKKQPSIWEILDELIGIDRSTLTKMLATVLFILGCVSVWLMYREVVRGRMDLAMLHGGFLVLLLALVGSIAFVLSEVNSLEAQQSLLENEPAPGKAVKVE